jgi:hypothetical protein
MVDFSKLHEKAVADSKVSDSEKKFPGFTKVLPGTARLFKIVDIRPSTLQKAKQGDLLWDVCDLVDKVVYTLNTPTVLERRLRNVIDGEPEFKVGDYLFVECPKDKKTPKSGGNQYWEFFVTKPSEQDAMDALKDMGAKRKK